MRANNRLPQPLTGGLQNGSEHDSQPPSSGKGGNVTSETNLFPENDGQIKDSSTRNNLGLSRHVDHKSTQESRLLTSENYGMSDATRKPKSSIKCQLIPGETKRMTSVNFQSELNAFLMPIGPAKRRGGRFVTYVNPNEEIISDIESNSSSLDNIFAGTADAKSSGQE